MRAGYFELYSPLKSGPEFVLVQAYLTLFLIDSENHTYTEILCIHSDPATVASDKNATFKQGPHLHVTCAQSPIPRCHFPLELANLSDSLRSIDSLTIAMGRAVQILSKEVLPLYN